MMFCACRPAALLLLRVFFRSPPPSLLRHQRASQQPTTAANTDVCVNHNQLQNRLHVLLPLERCYQLLCPSCSGRRVALNDFTTWL